MTASQYPKQIPWPVNVRQLRQSKTACEKLRIAMQTWSKQDFTNLTVSLTSTWTRCISRRWFGHSDLLSKHHQTLSGHVKVILRARLWPVEGLLEESMYLPPTFPLLKFSRISQGRKRLPGTWKIHKSLACRSICRKISTTCVLETTEVHRESRFAMQWRKQSGPRRQRWSWCIDLFGRWRQRPRTGEPQRRWYQTSTTCCPYQSW